MRGTLLLACLALSACSEAPSPDDPRWLPPMGSNTVFDVEPGAAPDHQLLVSDLHLGPDAAGEAHSHPWEEFLYVIEGSALVDLPGSPTRTLNPGESFIIPPMAVHTPRAGPDGVRAIVVRVHDAGDPVMIPAGE